MELHFHDRTMKVLLIEANETIARLATEAFYEQGFSYDHTSLGMDGVDIATRKFYAYDIIIVGSRTLDVTDPNVVDVTNIDVLRLIRAARVSTPIIIILGGHNKTIEALELGADDCMVMPINVHELIARMRAIMRRPKEYKDLVIDLGRLVIDLQRRRVEVDGHEIHITKNEFMLLEVLALHSEKLVRNETLLTYIEGDENLKVHLCNLRKKLGGRFISTVWGQGLILNKLEKLEGY